LCPVKVAGEGLDDSISCVALFHLGAFSLPEYVLDGLWYFEGFGE
jgi:hypothetical protein